MEKILYFLIPLMAGISFCEECEFERSNLLEISEPVVDLGLPCDDHKKTETVHYIFVLDENVSGFQYPAGWVALSTHWYCWNASFP